MSFHIRMGIPEMHKMWSSLQQKYHTGTIKKKEEQLYKKWGKALKILAENPTYPGLQTHLKKYFQQLETSCQIIGSFS